MPPPRIPIALLLSRLRTRVRTAPFRPLQSATFKSLTLPAMPELYRASIFCFKFAFVYHLTVSYIGYIGPTTGISMVPTIPHNFLTQPWILTSRLHRRGRNIQVGDIVTYRHPMIPGARGAKRVVGMPGDYICVRTPGKRDEDMEDGSIVGGELREEMIRVPEGHCWLAGDNLEWSRDSRVYGPVPLGMVTGKILALVLPFRSIGWIKNSLVDPIGEELQSTIG